MLVDGSRERDAERAAFDAIQTYSEAEEERLARQLEGLATDVQQGAFAHEVLRVEFLCALHARLFTGVRGHAGRLRTSDFGSEWLTFGPNRSAHRDQVPAMLANVCDTSARTLRRLAETPNAAGFELSAIDLAVRLHANIICIHPFEDGNGRTSRMLLNWILLTLGLVPVSLEVPKEEYRGCLNHFFSTKEIRPLLHLYIRLLSSAIP